MATSDEHVPAGLGAGLSRASWGAPSTFDAVRRTAPQPFWGNGPSHAPLPQSSNFDLNAPCDEDQLPANRGLPNFVDHFGSPPVQGTMSFINMGKEMDGAGFRFMDAGGSSRNHHDSDESFAARDQDPGQDSGPFVDYLSQFSGKKDVESTEKERPKSAREAGDFPDELLSLSASYHKKQGDPGRVGRPPVDGAALFLASGRAQDSPHLRFPESGNVKESRAAPMGVNFGNGRLDDIRDFRDVEKMSHGNEGQMGVAFEERSLFPRNAVHIERMDPFYSVSNGRRDERPLLPPTSSTRETLDLSNSLAFKDEKLAMSRQARMSLESSKEGMSLSLKRPEEIGAEEYKRRREEEAVQTSMYRRQGDSRDGMENSDIAEVSHVKRRRERPGGEEQRFQMDMKRVQNDQIVHDDKSIVWPPVVIVENTSLGWDEERKKWKGLSIDDIRKSLPNVGNMGNLEYAKVKCLSDGHGQRTIALVIFPPSIDGYIEAKALNDRLERSGKGRDQWMKVRQQDLNPRSPRGFNSPDVVSQDGKRILYGYMAQPEDMQRNDPHKSGLKWFIESLNEKVRKPAQQRHQMSL